jgi:hypothetical protein
MPAKSEIIVGTVDVAPYHKLCRDMVKTFERLGNCATARIDARQWHRIYSRRMARLFGDNQPR